MPFDPYESAAGRIERARQAEQEYGERVPPPGLGLSGPVRPPMRIVLALFALALLFGVVRATRNSSPPKLSPDCEHSRLALSTASVRQGSPVRWTATGPEQGTVILAVDIARFGRTATGTFDPEPTTGTALKDTQAASTEQRLAGCRATGLFGATVPPGRHTVTLFRLSDAGGQPVASAPLEVTER